MSLMSSSWAKLARQRITLHFAANQGGDRGGDPMRTQYLLCLYRPHLSAEQNGCWRTLWPGLRQSVSCAKTST